jgi:hypothetical protein
MPLHDPFIKIYNWDNQFLVKKYRVINNDYNMGNYNSSVINWTVINSKNNILVYNQDFGASK